MKKSSLRTTMFGGLVGVAILAGALQAQPVWPGG